MSVIREARVNKGMSQKELARAVGIDARTLRKIENGEHVSDISKRAVERTLGVSAEETIPASASAPLGRQFYVTYWLCVAAAIAAMVSAATWFIDRPFNMGDYAGVYILSFLIIVFAFGLFALNLAPVRGNTRIEISAGLDRATDFANPLETAKGWLGRPDITIGKIATDGKGFRLHVFGDFEVRDYPALVSKLRGFGLEASVHSAG